MMNRTTLIGILLAMAIFTSIVVIQAPLAFAQTQDVKVLIGFNGKPDSQLVLSYGGKIKYVYKYVDAIAATLPSSSIGTLRKNPKVAYIEPDFIVTILRTRQPPQEIPWGVQKIRAPEVWNKLGYTGGGSNPIRVGIIDTGIDFTHDDLKPSVGRNCVGSAQGIPQDENGHGTHVSGTVAALYNSIGVVGVAPTAALYAYKVLTAPGFGSTSDVVCGIEAAIEDKMEVINMSLGGPEDSITQRNAMTAAKQAGIINVVAAGNEGPGEETCGFPGNYGKDGLVITVAATDRDDKVANFSSRCESVKVAGVAAPGVDILSTWKGNDYNTISGTSMSTPHVAGAVALMLSKVRGLTLEKVRDILRATAVDLGPLGPDTAYGAGRIDAFSAVQKTTK